jgi:SAM-dependent methyltransferase
VTANRQSEAENRESGVGIRYPIPDSRFSVNAKRKLKDFLFLHTRALPYFRALLRAVESSYYQDLDLPAPVYDIGCGDGHFASLTFERKIDVGLDPWREQIREARKYGGYSLLVEADGAHAPLPGGFFSSAISNSVLEHIPHIEPVLAETARVLKTGAPFIICVPNQNFVRYLSIARFFDWLGLRRLAADYRAFFNRISRHYHCDDPDTWAKRLTDAGFKVEKYWHYFSPSALAVLEWGHYLGLPSWICRMVFGRWILIPARWNLSLTLLILRRYYNEPVPQEHGAYTFYITRRI